MRKKQGTQKSLVTKILALNNYKSQTDANIPTPKIKKKKVLKIK
ncbi:MAG TPA: hypothetical protein PKV40_01555 [Candidatus Kapabacteria bacterium]|nr:hypothetical protein [Candidatus Kapabacteria bacterium]